MERLPDDEISGFTNNGAKATYYLDDTILPIIKSGNSILEPVRRHGKLFFKKRLLPQLQFEPLHADSINREFEIGYNLDHPNIVRYIDKGTDENGPYIVVEYIDGITLSEYVEKKGGLTEKEAIKLISELLSALDYLHSKQIYHGDVKPTNILITHKGGNTKLIDFGHVNKDGYYFKAGGSEKYSAPEQYKNADEICPQSDIYSTGKVAAFMLTGDPSIIPSSTGALTNFIEKCTSASINDRPQNCTAAEHLLVKQTNTTLRAVIISLIVVGLSLLIITLYYNNQKKPSFSAINLPVIRTDTILIQNPSHLPKSSKPSIKRSILAPSMSTDSLFMDSTYASAIGASAYMTFQNRKNLLVVSSRDSLMILYLFALDSMTKEWGNFSSKYNKKSYEYGYIHWAYFLSRAKSIRKMLHVVDEHKEYD